MRDPYSSEITEIFHHYGYSFRRTSAAQKCRLYIKNRKFLSRFPPANFNFKLIEPDLKISSIKSLLIFFRRCTQFTFLYQNPKAFHFDWAVVRDKDKKKISFFDFKKKLKTVVWSDQQDFESELNNINHFQDRGVPCLPMKAGDLLALSATQNLTGLPVVTEQFKSEIILAPLQTYVVREAVFKPLQMRFERALIQEIELSKALGQAQSVIETVKNNKNGLFPYCLVHGDLTPNNILVCDGAYFLIDFERSFEASAYYDFIYLWLNSQALRQDEVMQIITSINQKIDLPDLAGQDALKLALALFMYDNLNYIAQYCVNAAPRLFSERQVHKAERALSQII